MKRFHIVPLALLGMMMLHWSAGRASAQFYGGIGVGRPTRPVVSPYLNLLRTGAPLWSNYYNIVRPQVQTYHAIQQLDQQTSADQQAISGLQNGQQVPLVTTGHPVGFQTQGSYFQTFGRPAAGRITAGGRVYGPQTRAVGRTGGGQGGMSVGGGRSGLQPAAGR